MPKRNLAWILMVLLAAVACYQFMPRPGPGRDKELTDYQPLAEVYSIVRQRYVEQLNGEQANRFIEGAIEGALQNALNDRYTNYIPADQVAKFEQTLKGQFTGVGIQIDVRDGSLTVVTPIESSPAFNAGVMPGDQIVKVDGTSTEGWTLTEAVSRIAGPEGSEVELEVRRTGQDEPLTFRLRRARIALNPVKGFRQYADGGWDYGISAAPGPVIGYVRVLDFVEDTAETTTMARFNAAMERLGAAGATGLIIDLRDNPGGILNQAVSMVDRFVPAGVIISVKGAHHAEERFNATGPGTLADMPIVVLINQWSASASEIVAGSLADHRRAVLVGQRSFGKGTMQETLELNGVGGGRAILKLTTAYYYLPSGRNINRIEPPSDFNLPRDTRGPENHRGGIVPHLAVTLSRDEQLALHELRGRLDAIYPGRRPTSPATQPESASQAGTSAATSANRQSTTSAEAPADPAAELLKLDRQLAAAVEILSNPKRYRELLNSPPATAPDP